MYIHGCGTDRCLSLQHACIEVDGRSLPFPSSSVMRLPWTSSDLACERFLTAF